ncbi:DUF1850 domain-containing protein [uncultured Paracoccus sp.]|uniref:DUF1850 domain-containing protein n=1 Tax=uncultured Paracoccus sp. TaxID=189685 RepID=UPI00260DDABB|nr:DUF1850 domain-containing protein [uncultured Paracoccus sp.]
MSCLLVGTLMLAAANGFTLEWAHSVERTGWRESWSVTAEGLHLDRAAVRGSGAGMEPGAGATRQDGWWVWSPDLTVPHLVLAASGATQGGWTLCADDGCHVIGADPDNPVILRPCPG